MSDERGDKSLSRLADELNTLANKIWIEEGSGPRVNKIAEIRDALRSLRSATEPMTKDEYERIEQAIWHRFAGEHDVKSEASETLRAIFERQSFPSHVEEPKLNRCKICGAEHGKIEDVEYDCPHQSALPPSTAATSRVDALVGSKPGMWRVWKDSDFHELNNLAKQLERELHAISLLRAAAERTIARLSVPSSTAFTVDVPMVEAACEVLLDRQGVDISGDAMEEALQAALAKRSATRDTPAYCGPIRCEFIDGCRSPAQCLDEGPRCNPRSDGGGAAT